MKLAVIDDQETICSTLAELLKFRGHEAACFCSGEEFLETAVFENFARLIVDFRLPGINGIQIINAMRDNGFNIPAILISGAWDEEMQRASESLSNVCFLTKPFSVNVLIEKIEQFAEVAVRQATESPVH